MTTVFDLPRMTIDFETRSELDVRKVGAAAYSEHPSTEILCLSYNIRGSGKQPELWTPDRQFPQEIINHVESGLPFEAHNVQFEYGIWLHKLYNSYDISMPEAWLDTMAVCAYRALPLGLDAVGEAVNLDTKKDKLGKSLLQKLSKPRKQTKKDKSKWNEDPFLYLELYNYCVRDVETEEELSKTIGDLPTSEYEIWQNRKSRACGAERTCLRMLISSWNVTVW